MGFRTYARVAGAAVALLAAGLAPLAAPPAAAVTTPVTYTWSGTDAGSTTSPNPSWSDGNNWSGGVAPTAGAAVDLAFPASVCSTSTNACDGNDDIPGLVVDTITIGTPSSSSGNPPPGYSLTSCTTSPCTGGIGITLDGGLTVTGATSGQATISTEFDIPITLAAPNTWNLAGPSYLQLRSDVTGSSYSLRIDMSQGAKAEFSGAGNEVGPVTIVGTNTADTLFASNGNGTVAIDYDLNGTDANPITASNVAVVSPGAAEGPLGLTGGWVAAIPPAPGPPGATGVTAVNGAVGFDSATLVQFQSLTAPSTPPTAGTDYPQITSTGAATLGDAGLTVSADCGMADGTAFTLLKAASVSGVFDQYPAAYGGPITDGQVIQAAPDSNGTCSGGSGPYLRIDYTSTSVTATVVPQPTSTTTVSSVPATPRVNQAYQLVATVAASPTGSAVPTGHVGFSVNGTPVPACGGQPVQPVTSSGSTVYQATCNMAALGSPTSESLSAKYFPSSVLAASTGTASVSVSKGTTATSLLVSTASPYEGQQVTYTATVVPASPSGTGPATPGGDVEFLDGSTAISGCSSVPLGGSGSSQATCQQTYASTGSHQISVEYLGDNNFGPSTSAAQTVTVSTPTAAPSSTTVSFSPAPTSSTPTPGQPFTAIATVSSSLAPSGTVSFYADGGTTPVSPACTEVPLGSAAPYTASCTTSFATAGSHSVTAVFTSSSATVEPSNGSTPLIVRQASPPPPPVTQAPTSTSLTASPVAAVIGQPVTYTAAVSAPSGSGTPAGEVSFTDDGAPISGCSAVALNGTATCVVTYDQTGTHTVTASYLGDSSFAGSSSTPVPVTVGQLLGATGSQSGTSTTPGGSASASNNQVSVDATNGQGTVTVSQYSSDPAAVPDFVPSGDYFDVFLASGSTFSNVTLTDCQLGGQNGLYWWDPSSAPNGAWLPVVGAPGPTYSAGPPPCITVTLDSSTSPNLSQLGGTVFTAGGQNPTGGYRLAAADGGAFSFDAPFHGSLGGTTLDKPIVGIAADRCTGGYWMAAADGGVFSFDAPFYGSLGASASASQIVGISGYVAYGANGAPASCGYWLAASDGGVFAFNAPFHGSLAGTPLDKPIIGMAAAG